MVKVRVGPSIEHKIAVGADTLTAENADGEVVAAYDPGDLPDGWVLTLLGDGLVTDIQTGFACGVNSRGRVGTPHLRPMNVTRDGRIDLSDMKFVPSEQVDRDERRVRAGDVLFNNTNTAQLVGKTALYDEAEARAFSNHMTRLRVRREAVHPPFAALALHQRWREGYFENVCNNHVSQASVSRQVLLETPIWLPPVAEQRRIVEAVEALLARVEAARARLDRGEALVERFRQAVLAAACSGELTEEWRETAAGQEQQEVERLDSPFSSSPIELPVFPASWTIDSIGRSSELLQYGTSERADADATSGIPILRMGNIQEGQLDLSSLKYISPDTHGINAVRLGKGDLLFNRTNSPDLVGKTAVYDGDGHAVFASYLIRVHLKEAVALAPFANYWLNSHWGREWAQAVKTDGVSQSNINGSKLAAMPLPLPTLREQQEIVRRVEALFELAEKLEGRIRAARARVDALPRAILARAFGGRLVPTEAELARREGRGYEPASALLERIAAERSNRPEVVLKGRRPRGRG